VVELTHDSRPIIGRGPPLTAYFLTLAAISIGLMVADQRYQQIDRVREFDRTLNGGEHPAQRRSCRVCFDERTDRGGRLVFQLAEQQQQALTGGQVDLEVHPRQFKARLPDHLRGITDFAQHLQQVIAAI
jgi:hypothetical protein